MNKHRPEVIDGVPTGFCECGLVYPHPITNKKYCGAKFGHYAHGKCPGEKPIPDKARGPYTAECDVCMSFGHLYCDGCMACVERRRKAAALPAPVAGADLTDEQGLAMGCDCDRCAALAARLALPAPVAGADEAEARRRVITHRGAAGKEGFAALLDAYRAAILHDARERGLDVERLRQAYLTVDKAWREGTFTRPGAFWPNVAAEYATLSNRVPRAKGDDDMDGPPSPPIEPSGGTKGYV